MTYTITQTFPEPVVTGLTLEVDGEVIAAAGEGLGGWLISLYDEYGLSLNVPSRATANRVLQWIGKKATSTLVIANAGDLDKAVPGQIFRSDYNQGNRYRLRPAGKWATGKWEYLTPSCLEDEWVICLGAPFHQAYPLTAE